MKSLSSGLIFALKYKSADNYIERLMTREHHPFLKIRKGVPSSLIQIVFGDVSRANAATLKIKKQNV